jgi:hypothetical protein
VRLSPHRGSTAAQVLALLEAARDDDLAEPFWRGVHSIAANAQSVDVEWHEPVEPRLLPSGAVDVECHLYDDDALTEAVRRRS